MREITLLTLPLRIQDVQTRIRLGPSSVIVRTRCRFGNQRRFVCRSDALILLPVLGLFPHKVHILDNLIASFSFNRRFHL